jgi:hypothetical protein
LGRYGTVHVEKQMKSTSRRRGIDVAAWMAAFMEARDAERGAAHGETTSVNQWMSVFLVRADAEKAFVAEARVTSRASARPAHSAIGVTEAQP